MSCTADLLRVLADFTEWTKAVVVQAVKALSATTESAVTAATVKRQQLVHGVSPGQSVLIKAVDILQQHACAANLAAGVMTTWHELLAPLQATTDSMLKLQLSSYLSSAVSLTELAAPALYKSLSCCRERMRPVIDSSSSSMQFSTTTLATYKQAQVSLAKALQGLVFTSVDICGSTALLVSSVTTDHSIPEQKLQAQQQLLLTQKLPELLVLSIAYQAAALHAAATSRDTAAEQQQTPAHSIAAQQQQRQGLFSSHHKIVALFGLPDEINMLDRVAAAQFDASACDRALQLLRIIISQKIHAAVSNTGTIGTIGVAGSRGGDSSSSTNATNNTLECNLPVLSKLHSADVFPQKLILPAVRLLMELLVLLPADDVYNAVNTIELVLLLLGLVAAEQPPPSPSVAEENSEKAEEPFGKQSPSPRAAAAAVKARLPLPRLSAAVAAGLLQPVIQLLSRVVIRALRETEPRQQQQQQQADSQGVSCRPADKSADRTALLQAYGKLLITVCQAGEPRHGRCDCVY